LTLNGVDVGSGSCLILGEGFLRADDGKGVGMRATALLASAVVVAVALTGCSRDECEPEAMRECGCPSQDDP
jgi:hypothetical protein